MSKFNYPRLGFQGATHVKLLEIKMFSTVSLLQNCPTSVLLRNLIINFLKVLLSFLKNTNHFSNVPSNLAE